MEYKKFKEFVDEIVTIKSILDELNTVLKKFDNDFNYISLGRYETLALDILKEAMDDKYDWASYWLYDLENGTKAKKGTVTSVDGKNIPIKTVKDLYNIIKNKEV